VMLSDEAGRLPEQLFLKVGQCLELAACLYSPRIREGGCSRKLKHQISFLGATPEIGGLESITRAGAVELRSWMLIS
jgi:hypothetical protein